MVTVRRRHGRSTFGQGLARSRAKSADNARVYGAEGRAVGEGDGGLARQLLLAFRRYRRLSGGDPEALARGRRRTDHRRPRGTPSGTSHRCIGCCAAVSATGLRWSARSEAGRRSIPSREKRSNPSTGAGWATWKACWNSPACRKTLRRRARKSSIGPSSDLRCRINH